MIAQLLALASVAPKPVIVCATLEQRALGGQPPCLTVFQASSFSSQSGRLEA